MFSNLGTFEYSRSLKEAFGFYIAYLVLGILIGGALGLVAGALNPDNAQRAGFFAGTVGAVIMCCFLAIRISSRKKLLGSVKAILLIIASLLCSLVLGCLGGLIPVTYLTTMKSQNE